MANKRVFYASHAVTLVNMSGGNTPKGNTLRYAIPGTQSLGVNTNFALENIFQLGRLPVYDSFPANPELDITINKVLDGRPLIWNYYIGAGEGSLVANATVQANCFVTIGKDTDNYIGETANSRRTVLMSGVYLTSLNYTFPADGNFTEELNFIGSHKAATDSHVTAPHIKPNTRVMRRQNLRTSSGSVFPSHVSGKCINNITISADLGREANFCLGNFAPFVRTVTFPLEITITFDVQQDGESDFLGDAMDSYLVGECAAPSGVQNNSAIKLVLCGKDNQGANIDIYTFDLGSGCALQSVSWSGGDTGGGNVVETYTYLSYNVLNIKTENTGTFVDGGTAWGAAVPP